MGKLRNVECTSMEASRESGRVRHRRFWGLAIAASCALTPVTARAQISSVLILGLPPHATQAASVDVSVWVTSEEQIVSVRAQIESTVVDLAYDRMTGDTDSWWGGSIPLSVVAAGSRTVTATATSASGAQATASGSFLYYPPSTSEGLTIISPRAGDVARPTIEVWATYSDPQVVPFVAYVPGERQWDPFTDLLDVAPLEPLGGAGGIRGIVDLSAHDPSSGRLVFIVSNPWAEIAHVEVPIEVRSAPDVVDGGVESDAGTNLDAGLLDAAVPSDAATDAQAPPPDAEGPDAGSSDAGSSDAGEPSQDAGGCSTDADTTHGCKPDGGTHHHRPRWGIDWSRRFDCSASPESIGGPRALPGALTGLLVLFVIRRRRARSASASGA